MKFSWNFVVQALGTIVQGANAVGGILPHEFQISVALGIGVIQSVVALISHFSNPDGSTAKVAYVPPVDEHI